MGHRDDRARSRRPVAPISGANMPPALTTTSVADLAALAALLDRHAGHAAAVRCRSPTTRVCWRIVRAARRAPRRPAPAPGRDGSSQPSVGSQTAPRTPSSRHQREAVLRLRGEISSSGRPNVLRPAGLAPQLLERARASDARRSEPTSCQPESTPVSAARPPVQVGAVHHHPGQGHRAAQLADQPGRVEGRAGRQLGAVDQHDVRPAELGQVVGDATSRRRRRR